MAMSKAIAVLKEGSHVVTLACVTDVVFKVVKRVNYDDAKTRFHEDNLRHLS